MFDVWILLYFISIIIVFGLEVSDFGRDFRRWIWKVVLKPKGSVDNIPYKPFFCPLCMTWWTGLITLLCIHQFNLLNICVLVIISYLTDVTASLLRLLHDLLTKIIDCLYRWLKL